MRKVYCEKSFRFKVVSYTVCEGSRSLQYLASYCLHAQQRTDFCLGGYKKRRTCPKYVPRNIATNLLAYWLDALGFKRRMHYFWKHFFIIYEIMVKTHTTLKLITLSYHVVFFWLTLDWRSKGESQKCLSVNKQSEAIGFANQFNCEYVVILQNCETVVIRKLLLLSEL